MLEFAFTLSLSTSETLALLERVRTQTTPDGELLSSGFRTRAGARGPGRPLCGRLLSQRRGEPPVLAICLLGVGLVSLWVGKRC